MSTISDIAKAAVRLQKVAMGGVPAGAGRMPPARPAPTPAVAPRPAGPSPLAAKAQAAQNPATMPMGVMQPFQNIANTFRTALGAAPIGNTANWKQNPALARLSTPVGGRQSMLGAAPPQVSRAMLAQRQSAGVPTGGRRDMLATNPNPQPSISDAWARLNAASTKLHPPTATAAAPAPTQAPATAAAPTPVAKPTPAPAQTPAATPAPQPSSTADAFSRLSAAGDKLRGGAPAGGGAGTDFYGRPTTAPTPTRNAALQARIDKYNAGYDDYHKNYTAYRDSALRGGMSEKDLQPMIPRVSAEGINDEAGWNAAMGQYDQERSGYNQQVAQHNQSWNLDNSGGPSISAIAKQRAMPQPLAGMSKRSHSINVNQITKTAAPWSQAWKAFQTVGRGLGSAASRANRAARPASSVASFADKAVNTAGKAGLGWLAGAGLNDVAGKIGLPNIGGWDPSWLKYDAENSPLSTLLAHPLQYFSARNAPRPPQFRSPGGGQLPAGLSFKNPTYDPGTQQWTGELDGEISGDATTGPALQKIPGMQFNGGDARFDPTTGQFSIKPKGKMNLEASPYVQEAMQRMQELQGLQLNGVPGFQQAPKPAANQPKFHPGYYNPPSHILNSNNLHNF